MRSFSVQFLTSAAKADQLPPEDMPEVAFAGRSNVGKSSLINALLGRKRLAKVSSTPGRTRTINFFNVNDRWRLADLPGYGFAKVPASMRRNWKALIEAYLIERTTLRAVVLIVDARHEPTAMDKELLHFLQVHELAVVPVATKTDKLAKTVLHGKLRGCARALDLPADALIPFSSVTKVGRETLWRRIYDLLSVDDALFEFKADPTCPGEAGPRAIVVDESGGFES